MKPRFIQILALTALFGFASCNESSTVQKGTGNGSTNDASAEASPSSADSYISLGIKQYKQLLPESKNFTRLPVSWKAREEDRQKAAKAWDIILEARKDQPQSERKLHVVYVTFSDRPALEGVEERYDHMLKNIQAYYADQMRENGFPPLTFGLDLDDRGKLVVHYAHVDQPMSAMTVRSSGPVSREAAVKVLRDKGIDPDNNHLLIVCQLEDGIGPYYGGGYYKNGNGWTCDQAGLDPRNFLSKEYFGGRYKQTVGGNATIYIGGTAHELGHAFGLPHTCQGWDYPDSGASLMGNGNHHYGKDLRQEGKGSFLAPTDALMLASVPLFNGMETGATEYRVSDGEYSNIHFKPVPHGAVISGKITSKVPCYAIVVHLDPPGGSDYDANTVGAVPDKDGNFSLEIRRPDYSGYIEMRVTALFADGTRNMIGAPATVSEKGLESPSFVELTYFSKVIAEWAEGRPQQASEALKQLVAEHGDLPAVKESVPFWEKVLSGSETPQRDAATEVPDDVDAISLVDVKYGSVKTGWNRPQRDILFPSELGPRARFLDGKALERFLLVHAPGHVTYNIDAKWKTFKAEVGVAAGKGGSVQYEVLGDGKPLYKGKVLHDGQSEQVDISVDGVRELEIRISDGGDGNYADWSVIGNPVLSR